MVEFISSDDWDLSKQQFKATTFIGKEPVVKPWNPRSKTGAAVWQAEVEDLLVWHGLREAAVGGPPTLQECKARCPSMSDNQLIDFLTACEQTSVNDFGHLFFGECLDFGHHQGCH